MFHPVLNENVASLLNSKPTVFHSFHQRNRNKAWQKLKLFFYSPHIFLSVTAQPTFSGDPSKSYIYLFIADKLIQCLQLLQMHPSVNHLQNVLIFVKAFQDLEMNAWRWSWSDCLWVQCHLTSTHRGIAQEWDPLQRALLENPVTQRQSWTAQTEKFFGKLIWERGRYVIWLVQQQRAVSLRTKGKQEGNYASKRIVCRHLRLGTVGLIAGFKLRGVFQPK